MKSGRFGQDLAANRGGSDGWSVVATAIDLGAPIADPLTDGVTMPADQRPQSDRSRDLATVAHAMDVPGRAPEDPGDLVDGEEWRGMGWSGVGVFRGFAVMPINDSA